MPRRGKKVKAQSKLREITLAGKKPLRVGQITWKHLCDAKGTITPAGYVGRRQVDWVRRYGHASVVLNDAMFLIGGSDANGTPCSDVWRSADGLKWEKTAEGAWPARSNHAVVAFDDKIFVLGGFGENGARFNDIWCSSDGKNWAQLTAAAQWSPRSDHSVCAASMGEQGSGLLLCGGYAKQACNDVWFSSNLKDWKLLVDEAPWSPRFSFALLCYEGRFFVAGGAYAMLGGEVGAVYERYNDVWCSMDGIKWVRCMEEAPWCKRSNMACTVMGRAFYVFGGISDTGLRYNDVWRTQNGTQWLALPGVPGWSARYGHVVSNVNHRLLLCGGIDQGLNYQGDVWEGNEFPGTDEEQLAVRTVQRVYRGYVGRDIAREEAEVLLNARIEASAAMRALYAGADATFDVYDNGKLHPKFTNASWSGKTNVASDERPYVPDLFSYQINAMQEYYWSWNGNANLKDESQKHSFAADMLSAGTVSLRCRIKGGLDTTPFAALELVVMGSPAMTDQLMVRIIEQTGSNLPQIRASDYIIRDEGVKVFDDKFRVVHIPLRDLKAAGRLLMRVNLINDQGSRARFWLDKVRLVQ